MPTDRIHLIASLEEFMLRTPERVRGVTSLSFEGLRARRTEIPMPMTNLVGVDGPDAVVPEASIEAVFEAFHDVPFGWLVGPNSPADLTTRLQDRGMTPFQSLAGLGLARISSTVSVPAGAHVREIGSDQREPFDELLGRSFGLPPVVVAYMCDFYFFAGPEVRARNYFGYVDGVDEPVGVGSSIYEPNGDAILTLAGSAVLPGYRSRGVYHALVQRRFQDAIDDGLQAAVIQAVRATSAPICRGLGFEELCSQVIYARQ